MLTTTPELLSGNAVRLLMVVAEDAAYHHLRAMLDAVDQVRFTIDRVAEIKLGIERVRKRACDLCLAVHDPPDSDSLSFLHATQTGTRGAPVILLTRQASLELDLQAMTLGAADLLEFDRLDARMLARSIRYALARRRQAERLSHLAKHDELTGLANRSLFQDRLERALAWARRHDRMVAIMVLDLNGFKAVNDALGHTAGDRLLAIMARRLCRRLRETDTVARLGGDEFALVIENLAKAEHAALVARKILDEVAPVATIDGREVTVTASLGVALHPKDGSDPDGLLRAADAAMYRAKAEGGHLCRFSNPSLECRVQRGALLESDLRRALAGEQFVLHFQPQVTLGADDLAISALIRWSHPELGLIGAERFLPLAEDSGLLGELTGWVFDAGCRQVDRWRELGFDQLHLALPLLSRQQLAWTDLAGRLRRRLETWSLSPAALEIELDEHLLLDDIDRGARGLRALKDLGVRLALDAFGRGPTSLRGLQLGVLDTVKLARELLDGVPARPERAALVRAIMEFGHDLGLRVVAEGVDGQEQLAFLRRLRCSAVQAFMSCPPLPGEACTGWLRQAAARRRRATTTAPSPPRAGASTSLVPPAQAGYTPPVPARVGAAR